MPHPADMPEGSLSDRPLVGIGLRQPHYREVFDRRPALGFVEVHSENFFMQGGPSMRALERARAAYPVSLHGVGLSLGSGDMEGDAHLERLAALVERIEPSWVSEHLSWSASGSVHFHDLLPLVLDRAMLDLLSERVERVQDRLRRPILVENISAYLALRDSEMSDTAFLAALARRTGCGVLLDLNNLYVNAVNFGFDAATRLGELAPGSVAEIHLAGHTALGDCLVDTHSTRVCEPVWQLYEAACARFGACPTLIEWDHDIPPLAVLLDEAARAADVAGRRADEPIGRPRA